MNIYMNTHGPTLSKAALSRPHVLLQTEWAGVKAMTTCFQM